MRSTFVCSVTTNRDRAVFPDPPKYDLPYKSPGPTAVVSVTKPQKSVITVAETFHLVRSCFRYEISFWASTSLKCEWFGSQWSTGTTSPRGITLNL